MSRSICFCDPSIVKAGETSTWQFIYTSANDLEKNSKLNFDILSQGRPMDWEIPQTNLNNTKNLIWAKLPNGKIIKAKKVEKELTVQFEFIIPLKIPAGKSIIIFMGTPSKNQKNKGNRAQTFTQRKKTFLLSIYSPTDNKKPKETESFYISIKGNFFTNLKIIVPSLVSKNRRFDAILRFEDDFENLTGNAPSDTLMELSYKNLRENLSWKLFVPETGFLNIPNLYFNEAGTYKIELKNLKTKQTFYSPPIKCLLASDLNIFWGIFHGESEKIDCYENIENCLRLMRDEKGFSFYASSPFDNSEEISSEAWKNISQQIAEFNEDLRFTTFLGSQWVGTTNEEGVRQFLHLKDQKSLFRKKELKANSLKKIYKTSNPKDLISIPSFTMSKKNGFDFKEFNKDFEKVVEIYNAWGSSETSQKDQNIKPIKGKKTSENSKGSIINALQNNCRFGFIAGGLDDRGIYEEFFNSNQAQYTPGLTAIIAKTQTREDLFEALKNKSCYATTGKKITLEFFLASKPMGSELNTIDKPGLLFNRHINGSVIGTSEVKKIEIIRCGKVIHTFFPKADEFDFNFDDNVNLQKVSIKLKNEPFPFVYYYLRITQEDSHMAWSSPIWVDLKQNKKNK